MCSNVEALLLVLSLIFFGVCQCFGETTFSGSAEQGNFQQQQNICLYIKHISILSFLILLKAEYIQVCNRSIFVRGEITSLIDIAGMVRGVKSC